MNSHPAVELIRSEIISHMASKVSEITSGSHDESLKIVRIWLGNELAGRWYNQCKTSTDAVFSVVSDLEDKCLELNGVHPDHILPVHELLKSESKKAIDKIAELSPTLVKKTADVTVLESDDVVTLSLTLSDQSESIKTSSRIYQYLVGEEFSTELIYTLLKRYDNLFGEEATIDNMRDYVLWHHKHMNSM